MTGNIDDKYYSMRITLADKFIAYLTLLSGLTISAVAVWYSVAGLVSIFAAAVTPIIVMGVALEVSKLIATVWLKLNWKRAPLFIRSYLLAAIAILMVITSMGIFGFLSKAHSDQSLVSGDVQAKIAVYDEKIKISKENIDANRRALKQLDEAVDQVMGRSQDEKGADKAVAIRRGQAKERTRLLSDIAAEQNTVAKLNEERAPIAAEIRKVEAEVGPIKYIAAFIYGDNPDANILERAVTWVIIIIVSVFDPLAVILLLASQYSFQWFRKAKEEEEEALLHETVPLYVADVGEKPTVEELAEIAESEPDLAEEANALIDEIEKEVPEVILPEEKIQCYKCGTELMNAPGIGLFCPNKECDVVDAVSGETVEFKIILPESQLPLDVEPEPEVDERQLLLDFDQPLPVETQFPENPNKGMRFSDELREKNYIFNGSSWIDADWSDKDAVRQLENSAIEELKKKSSYIVKEQDQQVLKTKE